MKRKSIVIVTILSMMMFVSSAVFAADINFKDMPAKDSWNYAALEKAVNNDLMHGYPDNTIGPNVIMDRAQMAAMMCRAFGAPAGDNAYLKDFVDINTKAWYYTGDGRELAKAVEMGLFVGNEKKELKPTDGTLREEAFAVVARSFAVQPLNVQETEKVLSPFADKNRVSAWAAPTVAALVKGDYIQGYVVKGERYLGPRVHLTRSEFAAMMDNLVAIFVDSQNEVPTKDVEGTVVVRVGNVHFADITIDGGLVLGEGVEKNSVILDGTNVEGNTLLRAGIVGPPVKTAAITNSATHEAPQVGDELTASYGPEKAVGPVSYQWQVADGNDWKNIANATTAAYTVSKDDLGKKLRVVATGAQGFSANSDATEAVVIVATKIVAIEKAVWSNTATPNAENVNNFMASLWAEDSVFSAADAVLTIHTDKITADMLTFINTNWGGSSVPVSLVFDGTVINGIDADANWSNSVLQWIDLKDLVYNAETTIEVGEGKYSFDVDYVGGYATKIITLNQPKWIAKTPNADDVNALMSELWDAETGVFQADGTTLTIDCNNITDKMKTKINTAWGGSSVPVKLVINGDKMKAGSPDENWDNAFVDWINLDDAVMNGSVERALPNNKNFKYTVTYVEGKEFTKYFDTLAQPVWIAETDNADDVNALMAELWNAETGVFEATETTLTIHCDKITGDMKDKIAAYWGGASVPVKLVFDSEDAIAAGLNRDANWDGAYLDWINLDDAKTIGTAVRNIPGSIDGYSYLVKYVYPLDTLTQPVWTNNATPNAADVNALMAELWDADNGVFTVDGTTLTVHCDMITADMKDKIAAYWGGASVPVELVFADDAMQVKGLAKDANWGNASLDWINLDDATTAGSVERVVLDNFIQYTVVYSVSESL